MTTSPHWLNGDLLYDRAACGLVVADQRGTILRCNETFCGWVGHTADQMVGSLRVQNLFTMGTRVFHQTHLLPLLQMQGSVAEVQIDIRHADGSVLPTLVNISRHREADSDAVFDELAFFIARDRRSYERELVLARTQAEQSLAALEDAKKALEHNRDNLARANAQLARADRIKDDFLATLAHELRNPLAPMLQVMQILQIKELHDPQLVRFRDILRRQIHHMSDLVEDLMDVSAIGQGKIELRCERLDLAEAVHTAIETSQPLIDIKAHRLIVALPDASMMVDGDRRRLTQVLTNLLNNAAKYTPTRGAISVRTSAHDGYVEVRVKDSGIGIATDQLANIFTLYAQLEPGADQAQGGLGIGLALVKGLVELHGGTIEAYSDGLYLGSEFIMRLPAPKHAEEDACP
jgi:PAS domain S-box-containing protein